MFDDASRFQRKILANQFADFITINRARSEGFDVNRYGIGNADGVRNLYSARSAKPAATMLATYLAMYAALRSTFVGSHH